MTVDNVRESYNKLWSNYGNTEAQAIKICLDRIDQLEPVLKKIKEAFQTGKELLINIDIEDDRPHKAIRLYNQQGNACGLGKLLVNDSRNIGDQSNFFEKQKGYITYKVNLNLTELFKNQGE